MSTWGERVECGVTALKTEWCSMSMLLALKIVEEDVL
jgi:hypothetical protein